MPFIKNFKRDFRRASDLTPEEMPMPGKAARIVTSYDQIVSNVPEKAQESETNGKGNTDKD